MQDTRRTAPETDHGWITHMSATTENATKTGMNVMSDQMIKSISNAAPKTYAYGCTKAGLCK